MNGLNLPKGYLSRPAVESDLPALVEMFNLDARRVVGVDKFTAERYRREWETPGFDLERNTRLVLAPDGSPAGYYDLWDFEAPYVLIHCWGRVHPDHRGKGIGSYLLGWAEAQACQAVEKAPPGAQVTLQTFVVKINQEAAALLQNSGFQAERYSLRMVIDLQEEPPAPAWPEGITLRSLKIGQDEAAVVAAVRASFKDHWGFVERPFEEELERWTHYIQNEPGFDPSLWFLALQANGQPGGEKIAGVCLCDLELNEDPETAWVGTLGVLRPWRKQGLGLALLRHAFGEFYRRGKPKAALAVDAESLTGATRLYEKAGMRPDPQREYASFEKVLRPGEDQRTQSISD